MKYDSTHNAGRRAPAVALISMAVLGLLMFFLAAFAPAYAGATSSSLPTAVLIGLGAMLLGLSILGALALVLIGFNRHRL